MKTPTIPCGKCGVGRVPLPEVLRGTLLKIAKRKVIAADIMEPGLTESAIHMRLESLREYGFLNREKVGSRFVYFRAQHVKP